VSIGGSAVTFNGACTTSRVSTEGSEERKVVGVDSVVFRGSASELVFACDVIFNGGSAALEIEAGSEKSGSVEFVVSSLSPTESHHVVDGVVLDSESCVLVAGSGDIIEIVVDEVLVLKCVGVNCVTAFGEYFSAVCAEGDFGVILNSLNDDGVLGVLNGNVSFINGKVSNEPIVRGHAESITLGLGTEVETSVYRGKSGGGFGGGFFGGGFFGGGFFGGGAFSGGTFSGSACSGVFGLVRVAANKSENSNEHCYYHHERKNFLHDLSSPLKKFFFCYGEISITNCTLIIPFHFDFVKRKRNYEDKIERLFFVKNKQK
jgi:hypothetical protein